MKYQTENHIETTAIQSFIDTVEELSTLSEENYNISELIHESVQKISNYVHSIDSFFFVSEQDVLSTYPINKTQLEEFAFERLINLHPEINFERMFKLLNEYRDIIVCDINGTLITDIHKTDLSQYYLGIPIISGQNLLGGLILKFNSGYGKVLDQIKYLMIFINIFSNILQKKLMYQQYENSTQQFSRMVNDALNGIYQSTEDGRIIYANPAFLRIVGYDSLEELKKIDLFTDLYISAEQRADFIKKIKREKKVYNYESWLKDKKGNEINVIENSRIVHRADGSLIFEGIIEDITNQTYLKKKLQYQTTLSEQIIENAPFLIIGFNEQKEIVVWNKKAEHITGFVRKEINKDNTIFKKLFSISSFEEKVISPQRFKSEPATGVSYHDLELTSKFNEKRIIRWSSMKIDSVGDEKELMLAFGMDITETKKLEDQLVESQKMESLGTLAAGIAYDFNKILGELNVYNSSLKSLLKQRSTELTYVTKLEDSIRRASAFTSKLIGLSRQEKRKSVKLDINHLINYVTDILEHTIDKEIAIEKELSSEILMVGDPSQIQQVILNIALNARDAIKDSGKIIFKSEVILAKSDEYLQSYDIDIDRFIRITIADTGIGIPGELQKRIFDPFYTTKSLSKTTGLGLSVVYNIVKNHNGYIFVDSTPGKGSNFFIYFPFTGKVSEEVRTESITVEKKPKEKSLILVVDDEYIIRDLLNDVLTEQAYDVIMAKNGIEGLDLYQKHHKNIDVTILDIIMPGMSGKEVFMEIRKINPEAKIIITSGFSKQKITDTLLANGANGFLPKPFNIDKLLGLIGALTEKK